MSPHPWDHMGQMAGQLAQQLGAAVEPSLVLGFTLAKRLFRRLLSEHTRVAHPNEDYVASKIQGSPLGIVHLFLVVEGLS